MIGTARSNPVVIIVGWRGAAAVSWRYAVGPAVIYRLYRFGAVGFTASLDSGCIRTVNTQAVVLNLPGTRPGAVFHPDRSYSLAPGIALHFPGIGPGIHPVAPVIVIVINNGGVINDRYVPAVVHIVTVDMRTVNIPPGNKGPVSGRRIITVLRSHRGPAVVVAAGSPAYP